MNDSPWLRDFLRSLTPPARLDRAAFVARYFPRYVEPYSLPTGIRLRPDGRCTMATGSTRKAQQTKRDNRVDEAFARYEHEYAAAFPAA